MITTMDWLDGFRVTACVCALGLAFACGDDSPPPGDDGAASTSNGATGSGTSSPGTSSNTSGNDEGTTSGNPGTSSISGSGTTSGEIELCNGWNEDGPTSPWLELRGADGQPLADGGVLAIECGGQGSWMFPVYPQLGGWELADPIVMFEIEVVVEGFPGPTGGSFYYDPDYWYDLECASAGDEFDGGGFSHACLAVIPPDTVADLAELDGVPATVHVAMEVDGGDPIVIDLVDLTLSAPPEVVGEECFF